MHLNYKTLFSITLLHLISNHVIAQEDNVQQTSTNIIQNNEELSPNLKRSKI